MKRDWNFLTSTTASYKYVQIFSHIGDLWTISTMAHVDFLLLAQLQSKVVLGSKGYHWSACVFLLVGCILSDVRKHHAFYRHSKVMETVTNVWLELNPHNSKKAWRMWIYVVYNNKLVIKKCELKVLVSLKLMLDVVLHCSTIETTWPTYKNNLQQ